MSRAAVAVSRSRTRPPGLRAAGTTVVLACVASLASCVSAVRAENATRVPDLHGLQALNSELTLRAFGGKNLELRVRTPEGASWEDLAVRFAGGAAQADALAAWNGGGAGPPSEVALPISLLVEPWRGLALRAAFPEDRLGSEGWTHVAHRSPLPLYDVGLWQIAQWFCGDGRDFETLREANALASPELEPGQEVVVPLDCLDPALHPGEASGDGNLVYGKDSQGPYALYRLKPGEALYSAVVVRFTGRQAAEDVVDLARRIAARSRILDLTDIPVDYPVKIPFEFLEPEHLPEGHPRRVEAEREADAVAEALAAAPLEGTRNGLEGVWIVLDAGHGGEDLGTMAHGIWEHDYVYDVVCRLKSRLERETNARVLLTLLDRETGCTPSKGDALHANRGGHIQTQPPFLQKKGQSKIGVNLRWYVANARLREAKRQKINPERVLFLSIHADSRSPSLRGMMAYVPGAAYRRGRAQPTGSTYRKFEEVRNQPKVEIRRSRALRSEGVSTKLAEKLVRAFRREGLPVPAQKNHPIRNRIIRGRSVYVPAVLRWNEIPTKLLVEVVNLNNAEDAKLLAQAKERQRMADALLAGVFAHFGETPPERPRTAP